LAGSASSIRNISRRPGRILSGAIIGIEHGGIALNVAPLALAAMQLRIRQAPEIFGPGRAVIACQLKLSSVKLPDRLHGCRLVVEEDYRHADDGELKIGSSVRRQSIFVAPEQSRHGRHRKLGAFANEASAKSLYLNVICPRGKSTPLNRVEVQPPFT
jgi:hypothetical protein